MDAPVAIQMDGRLYFAAVACREAVQQDQETVPNGVDVRILASYCHAKNCAVHPLLEESDDDEDDADEACEIQSTHFEKYLKSKFQSMDTTLFPVCYPQTYVLCEVD
jgi:hypothetical protein